MSRLQINHALCDLCGRCIESCPFEALEIAQGELRVDDRCVLCGACIKECPVGALSIVEERVAARGDLAAYSGVWVVAERADGQVHRVTLELVGKARQLADRRGASLSAVLMGEGLEPDIEALRRYPIDRIYQLDDPSLSRFRSETYAAVLAELIERERPEIVLCGATSAGRSFFPRVAALVKTGLTADCTGLDIDAKEGLLLQTRPAFGGNIMATIICPHHRPQMATVRPNVLPALAPGEAGDVEVVRFNPSLRTTECPVEVLEVCVEQTGAENIAGADVIVAGGRGVGSPDGFGVIRELASVLKGAVGASRAAVDAGWMPYAHQVGQTGKTVQLKLYVACGISGAVQHLVGMQSARKIIAINRDPGAPIFRVADVGLVGDLHVVVPRLIEAVQRSRREGRP